MPEVVTLGEAMALLLAEPGVPLHAATRFRRSVAGAESNVAVGLARLGHTSGWTGRVGDDALGRALLATLRGEGVDTSRAVVDGAAATGVLVRDAHARRPVEVLYHRTGSAGSRLGAADVDAAWVAGARVLHVTGITPVLSPSCADAVEAAVAAAEAAGVTVSFDPNVRLRLAGPERIRALLGPLAGRADLVLAGLDEAELLSGRSGPAPAADWFLERGATEVVLKRGAQGAWATDGRDTWEQGAHQVVAVDPVGAGDGFDAGWLSGWLRGLDPAARLHEAAVVGALAVEVAGDLDGLPTAAERDAYLAGHTDVRR